MSYVKSALIDDEYIIHRGEVSFWSLAFAVTVGICLIPLFGIGLLLIAIAI